MGRGPRCSKDGLNKGAWMAAEDKLLMDYVKSNGEGKWSNAAKQTGLKRCGKSCRLRWMNYLRPDIKRGSISDDEEELIIRLHKLLGNRWSLIAGRLPGRTDNEIKNYWNSNLAKKLAQNLPPFHSNNNDKKPINTIPSSTDNDDEALQNSGQAVQLQSNRVIMVTPQQHTSTTDNAQNHESSNVGLGLVGPTNNPNLIVKKVESQSSEGSPSTASTTDEGELGGDDHSPNFMMDFNTDEDFCKILDCDFAKLSGVDMNHLSNAIGHDHSHNPILVLPNQIMEKSQLCGGSDEYGDGGQAGADTGAPDFGSLASFLEADEDWLGNDLNIMLSD